MYLTKFSEKIAKMKWYYNANTNMNVSGIGKLRKLNSLCLICLPLTKILNVLQIKEEENIYDEVDEKAYSKIVQDRQVDDWIVDDGNMST